MKKLFTYFGVVILGLSLINFTKPIWGSTIGRILILLMLISGVWYNYKCATIPGYKYIQHK
jgi:hypothetical protein